MGPTVRTNFVIIHLPASPARKVVSSLTLRFLLKTSCFQGLHHFFKIKKQ
nr:MAG TPA: hypothetical protein [Caudoviricetes sp.]